MDILKKYAKLILSCVLVLASVIILPTHSKGALEIGKGNGDNTEIRAVAQLSRVFALLDGESYTEIGEVASRSVTMHEDVVMNVATRTNGDSTNVSLTRKLSMYITQNATYYKSKGEMESGDTSAVFDIEIYTDNFPSVYIKFNCFVVKSSSGSMTIADGMLGKWLDFSSCGNDALRLIDAVNREALGDMGDYLTENGYTKSGNVYTLTGDVFGMPDGIDGKFKIDLSSKTTPILDLSLNGSYTNNSSNYYNYTSINMVDRMTFENIDNTVVKFNRDKIYRSFTDMDDFDRYVIESSVEVV